MPEVAERTDRAHYLKDLERVQALDAPVWARVIREAGARRFDELNFPHHKEEAWKATNVAPIVKTAFRSRIAPTTASPSRAALTPYLFEDAGWTRLVFVDGFFSEEFSSVDSADEGLTVTSLAEAIQADDAFVHEWLDHSIEQTNAFIALNSAFLQDGACVRVAKNTALSKPVHIVYVSTGEEDTAAYPRNLIVLEESSEATIFESYVGLSDTSTYLSNIVSEIALEDNARLERYKVVEEGDLGYHLATDRVSLGRDTYLNSFVITLSGKIVRNELLILFNGEGGECSLNGLYLNDGDRLIDNALNVEHSKSRCRSRMAYKGVLDGESSAIFTGKVFVQPNAQQTDSDQLNNNLLLSEKATIDTKPQLEIFADDVKCTHGATVGSFPEELIFYFRSRGMDAEKAIGILTYGFAEETVDKIRIEPLRKRLAHYIFTKFSNA